MKAMIHEEDLAISDEVCLWPPVVEGGKIGISKTFWNNTCCVLTILSILQNRITYI